MELSGAVLESVLLDDHNEFAGFRFYELNGLLNSMEGYALTELDEAQITNLPNEVSLIEGQSRHTRLVGFRSTKRCEESKTIMSLQPIYYSIDEKMCTENLLSLSGGMLSEI